MHLRARQNMTTLGTALAVTVAVYVVALSLSPDEAERFTAESGPVETASAVFYILGAMCLAALLPRSWPYFVVMVAFALREFDLDKRGFTEGLLKSKQYVSSEVSLIERLYSILLLGFILTALFLVVRRGFQAFLTGLKGGNGIALSVLFGLFFGATSKLIDGLGRKLEPFGITLSDRSAQAAALYEEVAEFGMALSLFLVCVAVLYASYGPQGHS
ncbi:MAG: hypothetical protein AAFV54_16270 [Pseudomonadota bacterium]